MNVILATALVAVILIEFVLSDIPEIFAGAAKIGAIVSQLSLSYVASYIFFLIVVHVKYVRDIEHIHPYLALKTRQVVAGLSEITRQLIARTNGDSNVTYPSQQQFADMTKAIKPTDPAPIPYTFIPIGISNWHEFFKYVKQLTEDRIDDLFVNAQYLDSEHICILLRIRESPFFFHLRTFSNVIPQQDCTYLSNYLYQLSESARALDEYCDKHFSDVA